MCIYIHTGMCIHSPIYKYQVNVCITYTPIYTHIYIHVDIRRDINDIYMHYIYFSIYLYIPGVYVYV